MQIKFNFTANIHPSQY